MQNVKLHSGRHFIFFLLLEWPIQKVKNHSRKGAGSNLDLQEVTTSRTPYISLRKVYVIW